MVKVDWVAWHAGYEAPDSPHSRRLALIQSHIARTLDAAPPGPIRAVSLCAGDGRDILGVLGSHPRRHDVEALLVELDPRLAARAREHAEALQLPGVEVAVGDAASTDIYRTAVPADLVLVCGVFGNITDAHVHATIQALPAFCSPQATLVWTRHRKPPDLTSSIRSWLAERDFMEIAFEAPGPTGTPDESRWSWIGVGVHRYGGPLVALPTGQTLFEFT